MAVALLLLAMVVSSRANAAEDHSCTAGSKVGASKFAGAIEPPVVLLNGETLSPPITETYVVGGREVNMRALHDELQLTYIHGLVDSDEIARLVQLAQAREGFIKSPLKSQASGERMDGDSRRTSSSCPMLWGFLYAGREDEVRAKRPELLEELGLTDDISMRVAALFTKAGVSVTRDYIEPLQLVRYAPGEAFGPHHDYHASGESSVQGEQRAFTVLLFGSSLAQTDGGETHFPELGLSVWPRAGDAVAWSNVHQDGSPNPRSLHEGRPPTAKEKVAVNVWISDTPFSQEAGLGRAVKS